MSFTNQIKTMEDWIPLLDEKYRLGSLSSILDSRPELVNLRGGEFRIPQMSLDGLGSHVRSNGGLYIDGNTTLTWVTKTPSYDRNRKFQVDVRDNYETANIAFGSVSGVFIKEHVIPEIDAVRFSKYATEAGTTVTGDITDADELIQAIRDGITIQEEKEVGQETTYLFVTPTTFNNIMTAQTITSREVINFFDGRIVKVPQRRFVTGVTLRDGKTLGEESGGWTKAEDAKDINFLIIDKEAIIQGLRHVAPKHIPADINQSGDADAFAYRVVGVEEVFNNKVDGIYAHTKA